MSAMAPLASTAYRIAAITRKPGMVSVVPLSCTVNAPPMNHNTPMNVIAESSAEKMPTAKSIGASQETRRSSATRYSGFL